MEYFYFIYFLLHIPITVVIDATVVIPPWFQWQEKLVEFHQQANGDFLLDSKPLWFRSFVYLELILQLPAFVVLVVDYWRNSRFSPRWYPLITIYGFNAALTTYTCLVYITQREVGSGLVRFNWPLFLVYLPTFIIPAVMSVQYYLKCVSLLSKVK
ncbi:hypothetical protein PP7435_CHR1-2885 [Komagataella phaffii CBS 7435]|uniref:Efficient mitochondria targeting-associated protein 19 n=2 Tax=Komagataella phaffii TaxID=460519 RepID=C4QY90_KOMPG|nr:uncharacterized protein PAS_chr1-4_0370 [Komagataella phaffii GS115]AOA61502.1 GQ67_01798T0 [Komagataella phaffii]CAH2447035.1 hypothetical protein BQ9382_C1-6090 [Komagataella phaffii CBS 7435]AOA66721.1 GQ68_01813T0 [Komagataella phaffii GS115]CAY68213.1 hypothetical protein PAS_chr1-4_0370 [Komagataella phaffii GS115]SCV11904.1 hypothetical protein PP7435_CHR1-2885 [Komagataella phaffii CBS 7435]